MAEPIPDDPREALETALNGSSRDWSLTPVDAWLYGIICGWSDALETVAERHGWQPDVVRRLRRLHGAYEVLIPPTSEGPRMPTNEPPTYTLSAGLRIRDALTSALESDIHELPLPADFADVEQYARALAERLIANGWVTAVPPDAEAGDMIETFGGEGVR